MLSLSCLSRASVLPRRSLHPCPADATPVVCLRPAWQSRVSSPLSGCASSGQLRSSVSPCYHPTRPCSALDGWSVVLPPSNRSYAAPPSPARRCPMQRASGNAPSATEDAADRGQPGDRPLLLITRATCWPRKTVRAEDLHGAHLRDGAMGGVCDQSTNPAPISPRPPDLHAQADHLLDRVGRGALAPRPP